VAEGVVARLTLTGIRRRKARQIGVVRAIMEGALASIADVLERLRT
jgi:hypothetical protein